MKIYKFRPLGNQIDFDRAKVILETGHFWCSQFTELNDPMEGVFRTTQENSEIEAIYTGKCKYKICSFSGRTAFENPAMWGYYANGFKGLAVEIEVQEEKVGTIQYCDEIQNVMNPADPNKIKAILMAKLSRWEHEVEFRFLKESDTNYHKIGKIKAVYYGDPFSGFVNRMTIYGKSPSLQIYTKFVDDLKKATPNRVKWYPVEVNEQQKVV